MIIVYLKIIYSYLAALILVFVVRFLNGYPLLSIIAFYLSLFFLLLGSRIAATQSSTGKEGTGFKFINGVAITYVTLTLFFFGLSIALGMKPSDTNELNVFLFTPFNLDFKRICCLDGGHFVSYGLYAIALLIAISYTTSGYANNKYIRATANFFGISLVLLWYALVLLLFLISGLQH